MNDIAFDPVTREILFADNGDFQITENPSVQNGAIILEGRCFNVAEPALGIGFDEQVQGGPVAQAAFQLNRWVGQVVADGGQASWQRLPTLAGEDFTFNANVNYPQ